MTYEQMTSLADAQRKQLMMVLAAFFVAMVGAILFTVFLTSSIIRGQVASAMGANTAAHIVPAAAVVTTTSDGSSCTGSAADSAPVTQASTTGGSGGGGAGGGQLAAIIGGKGAGGSGGGGFTISGGTFSWAISRNVNSDNVFGSYNGSNNTATTTNTQGSNNTVSGHGELNQLNLAKNEAENSGKAVIYDSGNTSDSNNNKDVDITKTEDSHDTETKNITKDSNNDNSNTSTVTTTVMALPPPEIL